MNVLFFPYWPKNPYQPNLVAAMEERGVIIKGDEEYSFTTLRNSVKDQNILHLHWANPYLLAPKTFISIALAFRFFRFLIFQKARGRKLIWTVHNLAEHEPRHPRFELFCHRVLARLADGIIVHSRYARKKTVEAYRLGRRPDKIHVIPHGNYIDNYPNTISCAQARGKLGIGTEKKVFLFFGSIRHYKGIPELISAFTRITTGNEVLLLAGNPLNEQIKLEISQLVADRKDIIFFPEFVRDEDIQLYMNAADLVVFPFRNIFTSGSILLAMSFAKALLVPNLESLSEIQEAGGTITYDTQDQNGLEKALAASLSVDFQELGGLNLKEAQKLSWDSIAEKTIEVYKSVCAEAC